MGHASSGYGGNRATFRRWANRQAVKVRRRTPPAAFNSPGAGAERSAQTRVSAIAVRMVVGPTSLTDDHCMTMISG
jgi:hypothetical protein